MLLDLGEVVLIRLEDRARGDALLLVERDRAVRRGHALVLARADLLAPLAARLDAADEQESKEEPHADIVDQVLRSRR